MTYGVLTGTDRFVTGPVIGNGGMVWFTGGLIAYLSDVAEAAKVAKRLGFQLASNPLDLIARVERVPGDGLKFPRNEAYRPIDKQTYDIFDHLLRKKLVRQ